jgi:glycosyltransferase involved in cell wall biosynthesis
MTATTPLLTVVICTHNRARLLTRTLESLNAARRPPEGVQILVVANLCSDGTHAMLDDYFGALAGRLPLRWLAEPTKGKSHALNLALREVQTPLLAFVDDDQRVDAGFLEAICATAQATPEADLICGRLLPDWDGTEPAWVHDQGPYRIYPLPVPNFDLGPQPRWLAADVAVPSGGNAVVRTKWLARIGPFSTDLGPVGHDLGGSEDSEWFLRALQAGARLLYAPAIAQYHVIESERLALGFLMRLTYKRTASTVGLPGAPSAHGGVPLWAWRKLAGYALLALTSVAANRRRFYLMRCAATWGEIAGYSRLRGRPPGAGGSRPAAPGEPDRHA